MDQRVIHVYTHDSIGLGEDGPTHQPIEHAASLRLIPNLSVWRPADAVETSVAWSCALERDTGPTALLLTRQALPPVANAERGDAISRGGYVLLDCDAPPEALVIATGSEVSLAAEAVRRAQAQGRAVRLVSIPSVDTFERQDAAWRDAVLPPACAARLVVEAGATAGWWRYAGSHGRVLGIDEFGASGKASDLYAHFGLTAERIHQVLGELLAASQGGRS